MIPNTWHLATLGEIAKLQTGSSINDKVKKEKYLGKTKGLTYIATKDISFNNEIDYDTNIKIPESDGYKIAPANTALLCIEGGSAGRKLGFTNQPVCYVNKLCAFITVDVNSKFVYYFLQTLDFIAQFKARKHGLIGGVPLKSLSTINIPIPPIDEQKRIVKYLDSLLTKLNRVRVLAQKIVDGYELRRSKTLYNAFTGKLTNSNLDDWQNRKIKDIAKIKGGKRVPKGIPFSECKTSHPYIRVTDFGNLTINVDDLKYIDDDTYNLISRYTISKNDIYISIAGTIGKVGIIPQELEGANLTENAAKITDIAKDVDQRFLLWFLTSDLARLQIKEYTKATTQPKLALFRLENVEIPIPPMEEQKEIACHLDSLLTKEQQTKELAEKVLSNVEMMKNKILGMAFRGEFKL